MKFLEPSEMVSLLPAETEPLSMAYKRLLPIFARVQGDSERLQRLTASGYLYTAQVNIAGRASAVFWYRTEEERLIVDTIVSIVTDIDTLPHCVESMKNIAKANGCKVIEGCTARAGVAEALMSMDWYPVGVTLRKDI